MRNVASHMNTKLVIKHGYRGEHLSQLPNNKLGDRCFGPFKVTKKVGASSYQVEIPKTWRNIHNVFNKVLLTPYTSPAFPNQP